MSDPIGDYDLYGREHTSDRVFDSDAEEEVTAQYLSDEYAATGGMPGLGNFPLAPNDYTD